MISSLYINNTPESGKIVNATGNKVQVTLAKPIMLDPSKKYQVRLLNAAIVYCDLISPAKIINSNMFVVAYHIHLLFLQGYIL